MPIRLRLALLVAVLTALLVGAGGWLFAANMGHDLQATLERSLEQRARRVEAQLTAGLLPLASRARAARPAPDQSLIQVVSTSTRLRYTTEAAGRLVLLSTAELTAAQHHLVWAERRRSAWRNPRLLLAEAGPRGSGLVVVVGTSLDQVIDSTTHVDRALAVGGPLVVLLAAVGAWVLAGRALRPVEGLRAEAAALSKRETPGRLPVPATRDELASLATTLNDLLERVQRSLAEQRYFVAAASHELRTPLAALHAELELAVRPERSTPELAQAVATSARRVDLLVQLSNRLLLLAEADEGVLRLRPEVRTLQPVVADALEGQRARAEQRGVVLVLDADPGVEAAIDEPRLREVLDNLLDNAIRYAPVSSLVEVSLRSNSEPACSVLEVRDHGTGFPADFLPLAFEPFSRPDRSRARDRGGAGLGLAIVRKVVEAHAGTVEATNHPDGGAVVRVQLPAVTPDGPGGGQPESGARTPWTPTAVRRNRGGEPRTGTSSSACPPSIRPEPAALVTTTRHDAGTAVDRTICRVVLSHTPANPPEA
jgi:hypothetical protein